MPDLIDQSVSERFVSETDNNCGDGPRMLFVVHPDGTRQLALPEHVAEFVREEVRQAIATERAWQQFIKTPKGSDHA